ncbi:hypothetical protein ACWDVU_02030 [Streptomyces sp. NPDC003333]
MAPYVLAPGRLPDRITRGPADAGVLGAARLLLDRYAPARSQALGA